MKMNKQKPVGGLCPPDPPAPAFGEWGPFPILLSWALRTMILENNEGDKSPLYEIDFIKGKALETTTSPSPKRERHFYFALTLQFLSCDKNTTCHRLQAVSGLPE